MADCVSGRETETDVDGGSAWEPLLVVCFS
jgi:hypothetical protein